MSSLISLRLPYFKLLNSLSNLILSPYVIIFLKEVIPMILMRNIIREGHPSLTTPSSNVILPLSPADIKLAKDLMEFVQNSQNDELAKKYKLRPAVGLAAPQVNKLIRMFAMHCQDFEGNLYSYVMINPEITKHSKEETYLPTGEGCLSVDRPT